MGRDYSKSDMDRGDALLTVANEQARVSRRLTRCDALSSPAT